MKIEIEIPKEFEVDFQNDQFLDYFQRVYYSIPHSALAGNYEEETTKMFIKAFQNAKVNELRGAE